MTGRLRILLDRPLDRRSRLAVLAVAAAVTVGFAALVALSGGSSRSGQEPGPTAPAAKPAVSRPPVRDHRHRRPRQDPQDRPGSVAARRAGRELAGHRALQHVPYRRGGVLVTLVGARGRRAVLRVEAASLAAARRGRRAFLRRFHDDGAAYLFRLRAPGGHRGR